MSLGIVLGVGSGSAKKLLHPVAIPEADAAYDVIRHWSEAATI